MSDYRTRCEKCGGLVCDSCGLCNGCEHSYNWTGSFSGPNGVGKITTDADGKTMHAECRYEARTNW